MAELAWQLYRGSTIWEYEIPKWEGDLGQPNLYVPLGAEELDAKFELLRRDMTIKLGGMIFIATGVILAALRIMPHP